MQRWLRSVDMLPGITDIALDIIAQKVKSSKEQGKLLHLCLISDEMSIRKQVNYTRRSQKFSGFVTNFNSGEDNSNGELAIAKDALVFMAVGPDFRIAVAYFFLNGLKSIDRAVLTRQVLRSVHATGAKIISLTSDGLKANIAVAELLGADLKDNKTFFPNPCDPRSKIYVIFDPSHMLKLVRKHFAEAQLQYGEEKLDWSLLTILAQKQDSDNFALGNKLSHRHINYERAPMNVRLAAETFSNSVADALQQLDQDGYSDFNGCDATAEFIRLINNIFDVMNHGEGKKTDDRFKQPICRSTINSIRQLFDKGSNFIERITIQYPNAKNQTKTPVLKSRAKMGFCGFMYNITSTLGMYEDYIENGPLNIFYAFQYSQDHLETYFSLIRSSLGANNNPNVDQFSAAYRKLLFCVPHLSAGGTNCNLDYVNILTVSSYVLPQPEKEPLGNEIEIEFEKSYDDLLNLSLDPYEQHMCAILASSVETKIIRNIKLQTNSACQNCSEVFGENHKIYDSFISKKNGNQPCSSTRDLIVVCNSVFTLLRAREQYINFKTVSKSVFKVLQINRLYEFSDFESHHRANNHQIMTHKELFIFTLVEEYMHMKSIKIGERLTIKEQGPSIRRNATRNIILAGQ